MKHHDNDSPQSHFQPIPALQRWCSSDGSKFSDVITTAWHYRTYEYGNETCSEIPRSDSSREPSYFIVAGFLASEDRHSIDWHIYRQPADSDKVAKMFAQDVVVAQGNILSPSEFFAASLELWLGTVRTLIKADFEKSSSQNP